jgi:SAM-dependent methyltransferase
MADKFLVPVYLPRWLHEPIRNAKRAVVPAKGSARTRAVIDIHGERNVEWSFLSAEMPSGPGEAFEFGCEQGYMSLLAAQRGFHVVANDLQEQVFSWKHPSVDFMLGDFLNLQLPEDHFDLVINCSSVEHVGIAGRYGIDADDNDGDLDVMRRLGEILKPSGVLLMTAPCGKDAVLRPWCRVYGRERLPRLFAGFRTVRQSFWVKNDENQWRAGNADEAFSFEPRNNAADPHACAYALGCFVLQKAAVA